MHTRSQSLGWTPGGIALACYVGLLLVGMVGIAGWWTFWGPASPMLITDQTIRGQVNQFVAQEREFQIHGLAHLVFRTVRIVRAEYKLGHDHLEGVVDITGTMIGNKTYTATVRVAGRPELKGKAVHLRPDKQSFRVENLRYDDKTIGTATEGLAGKINRYVTNKGAQNLVEDIVKHLPEALPALGSVVGQKFLEHRPVYTLHGVGALASWAVTDAKVSPEGAIFFFSLLSLLFYVVVVWAVAGVIGAIVIGLGGLPV